MEVLIGFLHIIGSIITYLIFGYVLMLMNTWERAKILKQIAQEVSVTSGTKISADDLDKEEHAPTLMKFYAEKFSSELFTNKMSDFFGVIRTLWGWQSIIVQVLILVIVFWYIITSGLDNAVYAWSLVGFSIFSWVINVFMTQSCKILTGRSPGQAKAGRKKADEWTKKNSYS
jgi:hypothetical protein